MALGLTALPPGAAAAGERRDETLRAALTALHEEHFEAALAGGEELRRRFPDDPAAPSSWPTCTRR